MDYEFMDEIEELLLNEQYNAVIEKIEALDEDELSSQIMILLAHAYSCNGDNNKALEILLSIDEDIDGDDLPYHFELAHCYYCSHKYRSAINEIQKCLEIEDSFVDGWILMCYIALDKDDEKMFEFASEKAKELDEAAWEECFGNNTGEEFAMYTPEELQTILTHITRYFGVAARSLKTVDTTNNPISILYIPPTKERNYITLVTTGIGAYKANVPENIKELNMDRIELVAYLPPEWDVDSEDIRFSWVARALQTLGTMIQFDDTWLGLGHTISNGSPFAPDTEFNGVILDNITNVERSAIQCQLPNNEIVTFYQIIPIYEEEMVFKIKNNFEDLFNLLIQNVGISYKGPININRPNVCEEMKEKKWAIPKSSLENILQWSGADGCYATDKIMLDNKPVGFMYRENPDNEYDSGWRFMAGDETEEYMNNPDNMGIYRLNTLCNYDVDITDFLDSPVGTAYYRNKRGEFVKNENFHKN